MSKKEKRISVRLSEEAGKKLSEANAKGYSTSQFINELLSNSVVTDIGTARQIMLCVCKLQSDLEFEEDLEIKRNMRKELNQICQLLKLSQNPM